MKTSWIVIFFSVVTSYSMAQAEKSESYLLPITRGGKTEIRVARNFWSGEYPSPIIDVKSKSPKEFTKVKAYVSLRDQKKSVDCMIQNGIYHPWSKTKSSTLDFFQIAANVEYVAKKNIKNGELDIKTGEKISREIYLSEGSCEGALISGKNKEQRVEYSCDVVKTNDFTQTGGKDDKFSEQWIHVKCKNGTKAFILDTELLKVPGVKEGQVEEYGKVKAAGD